MKLKRNILKSFFVVISFMLAINSIGLTEVFNVSACEYETAMIFDVIELPEEEQAIVEQLHTTQYARSTPNSNGLLSSYFEYDYTNDYFYRQLNAEEKRFYKGMYDTAMEFLFSDVDLEVNPDYYNTARYGTIEYDPSISSDKVKEIYRAFRYSNPQFFFFGTCAFYGGYSSYNGKICYLKFTIGEAFAKSSARKAMISKIENLVSNWMNEINQCSDWLEKEEKIYTILCNHITYGYGKDENGNVISSVNINENSEYHQTIAGAIGEGVCVCNGYAMAFSYLCHLTGIDCIGVVGKGHAWNRVNLYGNWYEIDVTWMDTVYGIRNEYCNRSTEELLKLNSSYHTPREDLYVNLFLPKCIYDGAFIPSIIYGDVNGDQKVTIRDIATLKKYLASKPTLSDDEFIRADVNSDEKLSIRDVAELKKILATS